MVLEKHHYLIILLFDIIFDFKERHVFAYQSPNNIMR